MVSIDSITICKSSLFSPHLPILVGFNWCTTIRQVSWLMVIAPYTFPSNKTVAFRRLLPYTVAGPRWFLTNFPFKLNKHLAANFWLIHYDKPIIQVHFTICIELFSFYPILLTKLAISIADAAASQPLFPAFVPARSIACSIESVVNTPKITGIPVFKLRAETPFATSLHT